MGQEPVPMPDYAHDSYQPPDPNDRYFQAAAMAEVRRIADGATPKSAAVLQALQRNPQWRDMLVVVDWTGSMYEYGAQLLQWQQQHRGQIRHWVFFNDGDDALKDVASRMRDKPLGRTGGLYAVRQPQGTEAVLQAMAYVMKRGSGGDVAENNLEALLRAAATFPDRGDVVMIADNSSAMRDSSLRGQVRFPVHIIACDALPGPVRPEYVDLAWRSGGSVSGTGFTHSFGRPQAPIPADGVQLGRARYVLQQGELVLYTPRNPSSSARARPLMNRAWVPAATSARASEVVVAPVVITSSTIHTRRGAGPRTTNRSRTFSCRWARFRPVWLTVLRLRATSLSAIGSCSCCRMPRAMCRLWL
ncbi:MAG: hypothetical protein ACK5QE_07060 [Sphingobacteriia bacterium]